jgi:YfiH family protein
MSSAPIRSFSAGPGVVNVVSSTLTDGDFNLERLGVPEVRERCQALVALPWTLAAERHGVEVVEVEHPGGGFGSVGDIVATSLRGAVVGVWVGDCAPVMLWSGAGRVVAAHAGWRGIARGVLDRALESLVGRDGPAGRDLGAYIGPCIGPCCYRFGDRDLERVALGAQVSVDQIAALDSDGHRALDVRRAVRAVLDRWGVEVSLDERCTGCDPSLFSHRRRSDVERQVVGVWRA